MWLTDTTDKHHNMFGLEINHPPSDDYRFHDPFVLYKSKHFDVRHYTTLSTITIVEKDPEKVKRILKVLFPNREQKRDMDLLSLTPDDIEQFLGLYLEKKVDLQGVERAYDKIYDKPYNIFYYVETISYVNANYIW